MRTRTIRQSITLRATAHEVYETLIDSRRHARLTGEKAKISRKVGGKFTAYGTYIGGRNIDLVADKKIVQWWRGSDWPRNHFSKVTFALAEVKGGTRLVFTQTGVPEEQYQSISQGWIDFYWEPLKAMFGLKK